MKFLEPVRIADDGGHGPVWARSRRKSGGNPIIGLVVTLVALFGALMIALSVAERSVAGAGERVDGWIAVAVDGVREMTGQADEAAEAAGAEAVEATEKAGDAMQAGAEAAREELTAS
ncbi:MAG: hypothetical protein ACK4Z5_02435 [Brevundimonas sp.]